ncbi:MAG: hypothetical protein ACE5G1_17120, partial [bacterium]
EQLPQEVTAGKYKSHILLVGFSIQPVLLSVLAFNAERLIFLYTADSKSHYSNMVDWLDKIRVHLKSDQKLKILNQNERPLSDKYLVDSSDPADTYRKLKDIVEKEEALGIARENVAVDITGGKKSMVGGAFLQAAVKGCDIYYVDFMKYDLEYGPEPGTEFLKKLPNPYNLFNERELIQVKELFATHNYAAAEIILNNCVEKCKASVNYITKDDEEKIQRLYRYTEIYKYWDAFDYQAAVGSGSDLPEFATLKGLSLKKSSQVLFRDPKAVMHFAADRFQNAERRRVSGRLEDAIVRYAQVIEFLCRLKYFQIKEGTSTSTDKEKIGLEKLIHIVHGNQISAKEFAPFTNTDEAYKLIDQLRNWFIHRMVEKPEEKLIEKLKEDQMCGGIRKLLARISAINNDVSVPRNAKDRVIPEFPFDGLRALAFKFLEVFRRQYEERGVPEFEELLKQHRFLTYEEIKSLG